jgi:gliding motility-associated-like protein
MKKLMLWMCCLWATTAWGQVDFIADTTQGCAPFVVNFQSIAPGAVSWSWDLGGGTTSALPNPSRLYNVSGTYTISLTVTDASGQTFSTSKTNYITAFAPPQAALSANLQVVCAGEQVAFTDQSVLGGGAITAWLWDFGDGNVSTQSSPVHTYANAGNFSVSLTVTDVNNCQDIVLQSRYITVHKPDAGFIVNPSFGCAPPFATQFFPNMTTGTHQWSFGDNNTSTLSSPQHTYTSVGSFDVMHIITDAQGCKDTVNVPNAVDVGQSAGNIQVSQNPICEKDTTTFSIINSDILQIDWDFGNGNTGRGNPVSHQFNASGGYWVKADISMVNGCQLKDSVWLDVLPPPPVIFSTPDTLSCDNPHTVRFSALSPQAVSWDWQFGNGLGSNNPNPSTTYQWLDSFDVRLTITDSVGCENTVTYTDYIKVGNIKADFVANPREGCAPLDVNFLFLEPSPRQIPVQDNQPPITSYEWDFGDGNFSTLKNPTHTYTNPGLYSVRLIVTNAGGCSDTLWQPYYVKVGEKPNPDFILFPDTACASDYFTFSNQSTGPATIFSWFFGDGDSTRALDAAHLYRDTGTFIVSLVAEDRGCKDTLQKPVHVLGPVAAMAINPPSACDTPAYASFMDLSKAADSWFWSFGDGTTSTLQHPQHTYTYPDTFPVTLIVWNSQTGCSDTASGAFFLQNIKSSFGMDTIAGCAPLTVQFFDSSINASNWSWNFGDGSAPSGTRNPTHTYKKPGIYLVSLEAKSAINCASVSFFYPIAVGGPKANFLYSDTTGCAPHQVQFVDQSNSPVPIASWQWDFGNGTSSQRNDINSYGAGTYDVQLIVTDTLGCSDTLAKPQLVYVTEPIPSFYADYPFNCPNNPIQFTNTSIGQNLSYFWDFGDGDSAFVENPTHSYALAGSYTVSLTIVDENGCDTTFTLPNYITIDVPLIDFTADSTFASCPPLPVNFAGIPVSSHNFTAWLWNFGNANTGFQQNPTAVYTQPGTYSVYLTATAPSGCEASMLKPNLINLQGPSASFNFAPFSGCPGTQVNFAALGTNVASWQYDTDDGTLITGQNVSHIYKQPGLYWPRLSVFDSLNCQVIFVSPDSVRIFTPPTAAFGQNTPYVCDSGFVNFADMSIVVGNLISWQWNFGDGKIATGPNQTHYYDSLKSHDVTLIVTDNNGCQDTTTQRASVRVVPSPEAVIFPEDSIGCPPFKLTFTDISPSTNAPIIGRLWDFGFGSQTSTQIQDSASYPNPGTYQVQFTLTDSFGCSQTTNTSVTVRQPPQPDFTVNRTTGCAPLSIIFTDLTNGPIASWFWDFGDGNTSTLRNPTHVYQRDSNYTVRLQVVDIHGCVGEIVKTNYLNLVQQPTPIVDAGPPTMEICEGDSITLQGSVQNAGASLVLEWTPAIGLSNHSILRPKASPGFTTTYFFVAYSEGCPSSEADSIRLIVRPRPTISPGNDYEICEGDSAILDGTAGGVISPQNGFSFDWRPSAGLDDPTSESPKASPSANTTYTLRVTSSLGCVSDPYEAKVLLRARPQAEAGPDLEICFGDTIVLQGDHQFPGIPPTGSTTVFYDWQPKEGLSGSFNPEANASPDGTTTYHLTISYLGCTSKDSMQLKVQAVAQAQAFLPEPTICEGESLQLSAADSISPTANYLWLPPWGLNDARSPSPIATPDSSITYSLEVKEGICVTRDTVSIQVYPLPKGTFEAVPMENCEEFEVQFFSHVNDAVSWAWNFGDGSPLINGAYPSHIYSEPGDYDVMLTAIGLFGCENSISKPAVVTVPPKGEVDFIYEIAPSNEFAPLDVQFLDQSQHAIEHYWDFGDGRNAAQPNPGHRYESAGEFYPLLRILDPWGCWRELQKGPIEVKEYNYPFIPNIITPNNDEVNDFFPNWDFEKPVRIEIFDRWGSAYFTHDGVLERGWNGTDLSGNPAPEGVYFYAIEIEGKVYKGNVTLMR